MKIFALIACLALCSCAATTIFQDGKPIVRIEGDMKGMTFHRLSSGELTFSGDITHSSIVLAHGTVASEVLTAAPPAIIASGFPRLIK